MAKDSTDAEGQEDDALLSLRLSVFLSMECSALEALVDESVLAVGREAEIENCLRKVAGAWEDNKFTFDRWQPAAAAASPSTTTTTTHITAATVG